MSDNRQPDWSQLPPSSRLALWAAALLDQPFPVASVVQLEVDPSDLDPLFDSGLLREVEPDAAEFTDPALRTQIIAAMPWSRKRSLCEQLAEALQIRPDTLNEAARLYQAAHAHRGARLCLIRLAETACREGKYAVACDHLQRALRFWPAGEDISDRRRILREFARCARHDGRIEEAQEIWNEILGGSTNLAEDRIEAHHQLFELAQLAGDHRLACHHLRAAAELTQASGSRLEAARGWFALSSYLTDRIRLREALEAMHSAREAATQARAHDQLCECLAFEGLILAIMGKHEEASRQVDASLELAVRENLADQVAVAYRRLANLRDYAGDYPGARDAHLRAIALCRKQGDTDTERVCLACLSYAFLRTGEWKRALETTRKVLGNRDAHPALRAMSTSIEAIIAAFRGQRRTAEAHLDEALLQLRVNNVLALAFYVLWAKGFHAEFFPKPEQAAKVYDELRTLWHETEDRLSVAPGIMSATGFYADRGDAVALADCAEIVEVIYRENSTEETRATWQAIAAEVAWARGECSRALDAMQAAVAGYDRLDSPVEMALIRRRFARMLARDNQPRRSAEILRQAQEIAQKLGLRPFLDLLQQESDAGSHSRQASSGETQPPGSGLTPRQRQILALIARGMTDKEIAAFLHLSPRTVEMHVAMALDRLNCRTRSEAATRAAEHGWL